MKRYFLFMMGFVLPAVLSAQGMDAETGTNGQAAADLPAVVATSGGRLFFALLVGILLAFAFQWILTCISVGSGLTAAGRATRKLRRGEREYDRERREREAQDREARYREEGHRYKEMNKEMDRHGGRLSTEGEYAPRRDKESLEESEEEAWEKPVRKVQTGAGIWVVATTSISLFLACWLAASLVGFGGGNEDIILALAVWAGFMFSMMYLEAQAMGAMVGNLVGAIKGGLQSAASPLKSIAGAISQKAGASADEISAKVREEFQAQGGGQGFKEKLKGFTESLPARSLDRGLISSQADDLFDDGEIRESIRQSGPIDRRRFHEIASGRSDLSPDERRSLADVLSEKWNAIAGEGRGQEVPAHREAVTETAMVGSQGLEARGEQQSPSVQPGVAAPAASTSPTASGLGSRLQESTGTARPGISGSYASGSSYQASPSRLSGGSSFSSRINAFKEFLRNSDKHDLNPARIELEIEAVVIHPEEGYAGMERNVREIRRDEVSQALKNRRDLTLDESDSIADLIDAARTRMLSRSEVREHRAHEMGDKALARIRDWAYSLRRPEIDMEGFKNDFGRLLQDPKGALGSMKGRATESVDRDTLIDAFAAKKGVSREEAERMADQAQQSIQKAQEQARRIEEETRRRMEVLRDRAADQAEATRKLAASAAWWLVITAVVSGIAAVLGGLSALGT